MARPGRRVSAPSIPKITRLFKANSSYAGLVGRGA